MTLGENIARLRNERRLSQGDLAEKLNVSRQSVSKWETGASIPDLDRLLLMSSLFEISLDELVQGADRRGAAVPAPRDGEKRGIDGGQEAAASKATLGPRQVFGLILIGVGVLSGVLGLLLGPVLLIAALYLLLCGGLCLLRLRHVGLVIGWGTLLPVLAALPYYTAIRLAAVFQPAYYENGWDVTRVVTVLIWLAIFTLTAATGRALGKRGRRNSPEGQPGRSS